MIPAMSMRSCLCSTRGRDFWYSFQVVMNKLVRINGNMEKKIEILSNVNSKGYLSAVRKQSKWTMEIIRKLSVNMALIVQNILLRTENLNR